MGGGGSGFGGPQKRDGDWTCPSCMANVFASKPQVPPGRPARPRLQCVPSGSSTPSCVRAVACAWAAE